MGSADTPRHMLYVMALINTRFRNVQHRGVERVKVTYNLVGFSILELIYLVGLIFTMLMDSAC